MSRTAGLRGRLPAKTGSDKFSLRFIHEYTGALPAPAYPVDVSGGITDWGMDANGPDPTCTTHPNGVGDCPWAGRQHYRMAKAAASGAPMPTETSNQLVAEYLKYDHGRDEGGVLADVLLAWYHDGIILGFAPVDHTSRAECDSAMQQFHGLYLGVDLTDDADDLFSEGQAWTVANGETPDPGEGHCILRVQSSGPGPGAKSGNVTWGADQESTWEWDQACTVEAWVAITSEDDIDPAALAALRADIDALGGDEDTPAPAADRPHPHSMLTELADDLGAVIAKVRAWAESLEAR